MIAWQLFISLNTIIAYWLVTDTSRRRLGLWWSLLTEAQWLSMFWVAGMYGLVPISIVMFGITLKRLWEKQE